MLGVPRAPALPSSHWLILNHVLPTRLTDWWTELTGLQASLRAVLLTSNNETSLYNTHVNKYCSDTLYF